MALLYPRNRRLGTIAMPQKKNGHDSNASGEKVSSKLGTIAMPLIRMGTLAMPQQKKRHDSNSSGEEVSSKLGTISMPLIRMGTYVGEAQGPVYPPLWSSLLKIQGRVY